MEQLTTQAAPSPGTDADVSPLASLDAVWTTGGALQPSIARMLARTTDRGGLAEAALQKLADPDFGEETIEGRPRRLVYVEAVLAAGYPWALQLEPSDVARAREFERALAQSRRAPFLRVAIVGIALGLLSGLAAAAWLASTPA